MLLPVLVGVLLIVASDAGGGVGVVTGAGRCDVCVAGGVAV